MPTVSVVIPTYNRADVLDRAIDSALAQTYDDLAVLVVDDGSTDETEAVVEAYDDDRVRYVGHETNHGANVARNTGVEAARGEYVAFLDSDDEWHPEKLATQLDRIEATGAVAAVCDTDRDLAGASGRLQTVAAGVLGRLDAPEPQEGSEEMAAEILAGNVHPAAGSTLVVETDVVQEVGGFDEELDRFQDPEVVVRICEAGHVAYVDEPLVVRFDTGEPAPEVVHEADQQYLGKHAETVERAEAAGYDVLGTHNFLLAQHYLADGQPVTGLRLLEDATVTPRKLPGLAWATVGGLKRRFDRSGVGPLALPLALGLVALLVAVAWRLRP
ncbi:glycosyltransferase family 2 protein [Halobacteriales archaeon Cl-PHB]